MKELNQSIHISILALYPLRKSTNASIQSRTYYWRFLRNREGACRTITEGWLLSRDAGAAARTDGGVGERSSRQSLRISARCNGLRENRRAFPANYRRSRRTGFGDL